MKRPFFAICSLGKRLNITCKNWDLLNTVLFSLTYNMAFSVDYHIIFKG
jgi:hypothetical protein